MKICIFLPSIGYGGAEINLKRIGEFLAKKGFKIVFVIAKTVKLEQTFNNQENLEYIFLNSKKTLLSFNKLRKTINQSKPNIVLSTLPTSNLLVVLLKYLKLINCKIIIREANSNFLNWQGSIKNIIKKKLALFTFNNSDGNIFISNELRDNVEKNIKNKKNIVIYNPVFTDDFYDKANERVAEFVKTKELWVTTSRLENQKGLDLFFDSIPNLLTNRDFEVLVVGDGGLLEKFSEQYSSLPITFLGNVDNPIKFLNLADVFVFPSRREGLGNSLIEAQILGLQVVSSDCPSGPKEIIKMFSNGKLFKANNKESFYEAANSIKNLDRKIVDQKIIEEFKLEKIANNYLNFLIQS